MRNCAPIILFVYNRPEHTEKVIDALKQNELPRDSDLFIFSDNYKNENSKDRVNLVRNYLKTISGFKSINIVERDVNYGLKRNILEGVTDIIDQFGKAIVLEDDIQATPFFLDYMNDALDRYEAENEVMEISASHEQMDIEGLSESFFLKKGFCHGWATWKRAWDKYDKGLTPKEIIERFDRNQRKAFNLNGANFEFGEVIDNYIGKLDTWAVFWDAAIFMNDGLVLVPRDNVAENIGFDGTGEHCPDNGPGVIAVATKKIECFPETIEEDVIAMKRYVDGCKLGRPGLFHRIYYLIRWSVEKQVKSISDSVIR